MASSCPSAPTAARRGAPSSGGAPRKVRCGKRNRAQAQWRQRLERARYEADRARRQYDRVEPENRLVARTLEAAWEEKLRDYRGLEEQHQRFLQEQPRVLTPAEQAQIRRLASDLPALWQAATTTDVDRKRILRQIIDKVMVNVDRDSEWAEARVHWVGGHQTYTRFRRPVARLEQLSTWAQVRQRIAALKAEGRTVPEMVEQLNREGLRPPNQKSFTVASVRTWLSRYGLTKARRPARQLGLKRHECLLADLAVELDVSYQTIYAWIRGGRLKARQVGGRHGQWVVHADAAVRSKLRAAKRRSKKDTTSDGGARSGGARRSPKV